MGLAMHDKIGTAVKAESSTLKGEVELSSPVDDGE